ncbi:hypothetical protein RhiLY_05404 [Ceratobasidium sp. AG-Ba]|nr:hypothetical protein RhiLY_05404 [Ceratobasidium sp. AG-Ba]
MIPGRFASGKKRANTCTHLPTPAAADRALVARTQSQPHCVPFIPPSALERCFGRGKPDAGRYGAWSVLDLDWARCSPEPPRFSQDPHPAHEPALDDSYPALPSPILYTLTPRLESTVAYLAPRTLAAMDRARLGLRLYSWLMAPDAFTLQRHDILTEVTGPPALRKAALCQLVCQGLVTLVVLSHLDRQRCVCCT